PERRVVARLGRDELVRRGDLSTVLANLVVVVDEGREPVGRVDLPRQLAARVPDQVLVERLAAVGVERVGLEPVHAEASRAREEPERVATDGTADAAVQVIERVHRARRGEAALALLLADVRALEVVAGRSEERRVGKARA